MQKQTLRVGVGGPVGSGKTALPFGTFLAVAVIFWLYLPSSWRLMSPL